jgi:hypothetical protein
MLVTEFSRVQTLVAATGRQAITSLTHLLMHLLIHLYASVICCLKKLVLKLENIILSEVSLAQKTKNRMFSLICGH